MIEARRVTRPGGVVAITVWGDPAKMEMASVITALGPLLPPPPPGAAGPFALSDKAGLRRLAAAAGLQTEAVFDVADKVRYPDLQTAVRGLNASGVSVRAIGIVGEAAAARAYGDAVAAYRTDRGDYLITAAFRCLFARA